MAISIIALGVALYAAARPIPQPVAAPVAVADTAPSAMPAPAPEQPLIGLGLSPRESYEVRTAPIDHEAEERAWRIFMAGGDRGSFYFVATIDTHPVRPGMLSVLLVPAGDEEHAVHGEIHPRGPLASVIADGHPHLMKADCFRDEDNVEARTILLVDTWLDK